MTVLATALAAAAVLPLAVDASLAQEKDGSLTVGTYDLQQVAQEAGLQQRMMQQMQDLQQRMQQAQQSGDQQAMAGIQAEAQRIQQGVATEFEAEIDATLASVAEDVGVQVIAPRVSYAAPGVETKDVTQRIVDAMNGEADVETPAAP